MECPIRISQSWKFTSYDGVRKKWRQHPIVNAKQTHFDKMKPVNRQTWFEFIRKGWLSVTDDMRKWLDENGYEDVKRIS